MPDDQKKMIEAVQNLAEAVGVSSENARRAAESAEEAKQAVVGGGKLARVAQSARNLASSSGKVLSSVLPRENAKLFTKLLAGVPLGEEKPSGAEKLSTPSVPNLGRKQPQRVIEVDAAAPPRQNEGGKGFPAKSIKSAIQQPMGDVGQNQPQGTKEVRPLLTPEPPPLPRNVKPAGLGETVRGIARELLGLKGSNVNPIIAEDAEPLKQAKPLAQPPTLPGIGGKIQHFREWAGGKMFAAGERTGGRWGGAMQEAGSYMAGNRAVAAGSAMRLAAGGAAGGGGGAGAVAAGGAAAGGAAGGGIVAGALSVAITAMTKHPLAAAVTLATSLYSVTKLFQSLSESIMEANRELSRYSAATANAFACMDYHKIMLNLKTAQGTSGTTGALANSVMQMREAMQPVDQTMRDVKNLVGIGLANVATIGAKILNVIIEPLRWLTDFCKWIMGTKDEDKGWPFVNAMNMFVGKQRPLNRKMDEDK